MFLSIYLFRNLFLSLQSKMLDVLSNAVSTLSAKENGESSDLIESVGVGVMGNLGTSCHTLNV